MKILIIEDEFIVAAYMKSFLKKNGHEVVAIADDMQSSLGALELEPDLCLVDIRLSNGDSGLEVAEHLLDKKIPFAFVSANNEKDILHKASKLNPTGFFPKPINEIEILNFIDNLN